MKMSLTFQGMLKLCIKAGLWFNLKQFQNLQLL